MWTKYFIAKFVSLSCALCFASIVLASDNKQQDPFSINYSPSGLLISNQTQSFKTNLSGYIMLDVFKFQGDIPGFNSGSNLNYARLFLDGVVLYDWGYSFGYEFTSGTLKNAYVAYNGWKDMYLKIGQFYPNVSLGNWVDNNATDFLERPLFVNSLTPNYSQGLAYGINNSQLAFHTSAYSAGTSQSVSGRMPLGAAARFIYSPVHTETRVLDFGFSAWYNQTDSNRSVTYSEVPEIATRNSNTTVNTGAISNVSNTTTGGLETACVYGPWNMQAEYLRTFVKRNMGDQNLQFDGYYATGSYFFTGESMKYDFPSGGFVGVSSINNKRFGAWQILARISHLNLNDKNIYGGKETNATLGLNWYVNQFVTFKANYIRAMVKLPNNGVSANDNIFALRAQLLF